jgi:probable F420-dependent oxidoreductase
VHLGVILPNFGPDASPDAVRLVGEAAEEVGFDSIWVTEHIIVGPEAVDPYGRVLDPLCTLSWLAGITARVGLGTSIVLVPLRNPIHLAKEAATLQLLSEGRLRLGVGVGWHEDEYRFMGMGFEDRGRRMDESLRLMRALWAGEGSFSGEYWSFDGATFAPLPERPPEIWVGGRSERAVRRARELGDVWHPSRVDAEAVARTKERWPDLAVVPRLSSAAPTEVARQIEAVREAGAEGAVVNVESDPEGAPNALREVWPATS